MHVSADKPKVNKHSLPGWAITGLVILVFVGAQQIHPAGLYGLIRDFAIGLSTSSKVKEPRDRMLASLIPMGAAAICLKDYGDSVELRRAVADYSLRNHTGMQKLINEIKVAGGMSRAEKDLIDREAYQESYRFVGEGTTAKSTCFDLVGRLNSGEFDI
jgi:hypothetical protein